MTTITFKDKSTLQAEDYSTATEIVVKTTADKVGDIIKQITSDNLSSVSIGERVAEKVLPTNNNTFSINGDEITITFKNRYLSDAEKIKEQLDSLREAIDELAESEA